MNLKLQIKSSLADPSKIATRCEPRTSNHRPVMSQLTPAPRPASGLHGLLVRLQGHHILTCDPLRHVPHHRPRVAKRLLLRPPRGCEPTQTCASPWLLLLACREDVWPWVQRHTLPEWCEGRLCRYCRAFPKGPRNPVISYLGVVYWQC